MKVITAFQCGSVYFKFFHLSPMKWKKDGEEVKNVESTTKCIIMGNFLRTCVFNMWILHYWRREIFVYENTRNFCIYVHILKFLFLLIRFLLWITFRQFLPLLECQNMNIIHCGIVEEKKKTIKLPGTGKYINLLLKKLINV